MTSNVPVSLRPAPIAPSTTAPSAKPVEVKPTACSTCVRRKVKCDKLQPCSTCKSGRFVCEYLDPPPRKRKRKDYEELQDRLDRYEHLLKQNGILAKQEPTSPPPKPISHGVDPTPRTSAPGSQATYSGSVNAPSSHAGILVAGPGPGQTRYVESHLWKDLGDDLRSSDDDDEAEADPTPVQGPTAHPSPADLVSAGLFGASPPSFNFADLHPSAADAKKLWQVYLRNIDPIIKFVHGPSTTALLETTVSNPASLSKEAECLLFSIYHFAVTSMEAKERLEMLGSSWTDVQKKYHDATRQALIGCSFYQTTSLTVLQAYTLLLISVRFRYNPHTFWILCGIAVRLAQRMGLHSEDEQHLNPFDVQIRRRVWWHILLTDNFAAQQAGTTVATIPADLWDAPRPLNIDDSDLWPNMTESPREKNAATDMMIFLVRVEITSFRAKLSTTWERLTPEGLEAALKQLEDTVEGKYLRYCDVTDPAHYLIMVGTRAAMLNARLRTRLSRMKAGTATTAERKEIFSLALKILDHDVALTSSPLTARYSWQWQAFFSWEPLICALKEMCQEQEPMQLDTAWEKIERVFAGHPNILTPSRSIEVALGRLTLRAWELTLQRSSGSRAEPACVAALKEAFKKRIASHRSPGSAKTPANIATARTNFATAPLTQDAKAVNDPLAIDSAMWEDQGIDGADIDWKFWDDLIRNSEVEGGTF